DREQGSGCRPSRRSSDPYIPATHGIWRCRQMTKFSRRRFLGTAAGAAAATLLPAARPRAQGSGRLVFVGWGGSYQDAQRKAHLEPFKEKKGIDFVEIPGGPRLAKLKAQVDANNVEWDIIDLEWSDMLRAGRAGL